MNAKVKALESLYRRKKITKDGLKKAVVDGVLSAEQYKELTGEDFPVSGSEK